MRAFPKRYIGDGAYVECSGWSLILTTENGICTTNTVVIDMNDMPAPTKGHCGRYGSVYGSRRAFRATQVPESRRGTIWRGNDT